MAEFRINVVVDPQRARPGIDEVRAELDSLDEAGSRINDNITNLARDLDLPGEAVSDLTTELTDGFELATEATEALQAANDATIGTVTETAEAVQAVGTAADSVVSTSDAFEDLRRRMASISDQADNLAGGLGNSGDAANDAVAGLGRSSGLLRGLLVALGAVAVAVAAVAAAALLTSDRTKDAFRELGIDLLDLGRATLAAFREVLGPVDDFLVDAINAARSGVSSLTDEILRLGGVTDFVTTRQRQFNEAFADASEVGERFSDNAIEGLERFGFSLQDARQAIGLTESELIDLRAAIFFTDARRDLARQFADAVADVNQQLADGTINANEHAGAIAGLEAEQARALQRFDELQEDVRGYSADLAIATEENKRLEDALATFNSLQSEDSIIQQQIDDLLFLRDQAAPGARISMEQFVAAVTELLGRIPEEAQRPFTELEQIAAAGARNIEGVFADFLFDPFETGLDGLIVGFAEAIRRMTADALAAQLFEALFGDIPGRGGGPGGLGGVFSGIFGGGFGSGGTPGFQNGGEFTVGGSGGPDSQLVVFRASPMENVTITPPGQSTGGDVSVAPPQVNVSSVNVLDTADITAAMEGAEGDRVFLNFISRKARAINNQLGRQ